MTDVQSLLNKKQILTKPKCSHVMVGAVLIHPKSVDEAHVQSQTLQPRLHVQRGR